MQELHKVTIELKFSHNGDEPITKKIEVTLDECSPEKGVRVSDKIYYRLGQAIRTAEEEWNARIPA